jgi:hypothetical protein
MKMALIALAMGTSTFSLGLPAMADNLTVAVGPAGGIAFGYRDGYWDRGHNWHAWENRRAAAAYRAENREHYYEYRHTRDHDGGWRDHERYWETH